MGNNAIPKIPLLIALPLNKLSKRLKQKPQSSHSNEMPRPEPLPTRRISRESIKLFLERSLQRLKTTYIDNYLLHEGVPSFLDDDAKEYLMEAKKIGLIKKIGVAASYVNIELLNPEELSDWDILQYENGMLYDTDNLRNKFPDQLHYYHSSLKYLHTNDQGGLAAKKNPAMALAGAIIKNPTGKIIFSSSVPRHISENISLLRSYLTEQQVLEKQSGNAVH